MKSEKGIMLSDVLLYIELLLAGVLVGLNIGSRLSPEGPDFSMGIMLVVVILGCIIIPSVKRKEK